MRAQARFGRAGTRATVALATILAGGLALAHAHLESAVPAGDSKSAEVTQIRLGFSEPVEPKLSTIRLETLDERTVTEPAAEVAPDNHKVLQVHLFEKLPPGQYRVRWAVVAADGHRMSGSYQFLVSH